MTIAELRFTSTILFTFSIAKDIAILFTQSISIATAAVFIRIAE